MTTKTIEEYKQFYIGLKEEFGTAFSYESALKVQKSLINKLENIYLLRNSFSEELRDKAYAERQEKCKATSALHSLIREVSN